jgi:WD40 repeat protein/transcriptional regulator with XRE-family HTH domain
MPASISSTTLEKFSTFGDLLRFLRRRIGITQIELATAVGYSDTQISRLEQNLRLPDIPTIEARFISVLGLEAEPNAMARLLDLAANVRREDAPGLGLSPYKGLSYFDEADADLFVGREALTTKFIERVFSLVSGGSRFFAIVGASGSGKSSLVRAGLVSALRWNQASTDWHIHVLTPTAHPLESLAASLTQGTSSVTATATLMDDLAQEPRSLQIFAKRKLGSSNGSCLLLVIDQFEELFALCHSEEERASFIENLLTAVSEVDGPVIVLITLRADFYAHCANHAQLREALAKNQEYIGAMNDEELRRAIEEPARRGRWEFEPGLVDLLLHEVGREPGALPLLSHALLETWQRRRGRTLTLSGYASSGGVRGAIAETAETVFSDQFTQEQRAIARRIFLRLTELGDETGAGDTRRRATFNELILKPEEATTTRAVLKALADARLITTSENAAEVAHEALIREWPTLHRWLEENREGLRLHHQLTEAAQEWFSMGRESDMLYRGARLAQTREWASAHHDEMNELEGEFLSASMKASDRESEEREAQRQRELEAARKLAESEKQRAEVERQRAAEQLHTAGQLRRRAVYLISVLAVAIIAALTAGILANRNATLAVQNASIAQTAQSASTRAVADFTRSEAQRLAAEANNLMLNNGDPNLIALLAIRSLAMKYTPSADAVLTNLTSLETPPHEFRLVGKINGVAISPDGKYLAAGSVDNGNVSLWDLASGQSIRVFTGHTADVGGVAFSPDGKYLAAASRDSTVRLWEIATGQTAQIFSASAGMDYIAFSPDGRYIAGTGVDPAARIWDVATGDTVHVLTGHTSYLTRVAYAPDGKYVLTGSGDSTARLWDAATGDQVRVFSGHTSDVSSVAFTPDGKYVATGDDHTVRLWDITTGQIAREFTGHKPGTWVSGIAFSPDGKYMVSVSADETARLWDAATGQFIRYLGVRQGLLQDVTFSPDSRLVATAGDSGIARVWNLQTFQGGMQFIGHIGAVWQASFSPDGKLIVTASEDNTAHIWNAATGQLMIILKGHTMGLGNAVGVRGAVFWPNGKMVLTAGVDGTARLWDATTGQELRRFEGHTDLVNRAVFSPDGKYVVTASHDGTARVWDAQTAQMITIYLNQGPRHINRVVFSPDGKTVATSGDDGTARIWDPLTGEDLMVFKGHTDIVTGIAFSPDGKYLVTASDDGTSRLWEVANGQEVRRFAGHPGRAFGVGFSPDGKYVLTSGDDGTARLWDMQRGLEVRRFTGHTDQARDVAFSPDGRYILTASHDNTARLWLTELNDSIQAVCALLTRDLTPAERIQFDISDQGPSCPAQ